MLRALIPGIDLVAAALHFGLGVYVFTLDWKSRSNRLFGLLAFVFAYWSLMTGLYTAAATPRSAELFYLITAPSWIAAPFAFYLFIFEFTGKGRSRAMASVGLIFKIVGAAAAASFIARVMAGPLTAVSHRLTPLGWAEIPYQGAWSVAFIPYYIGFPVIGLTILARWASREGRIAGKQARIIIATGIVSLASAAAAEQALPFLGFAIPPLGPAAFVIWTIGISHAIARYRFMALTPATAAADIMRSMSELLFLASDDGTVRMANPAAARLLGYGSEAELAGKRIRDIFPDAPAVSALLDPDAENKQGSAREISTLTREGVPIVLSATSVALRDADGDRAGVGLIMRDVTGERAAQDELQYMATHDTLTGLPNRALLKEALTNALALARRDRTSVGVLLIDVDHFKKINDTLGHQQGDFLLREVAKRIHGNLRESDTIGRLGGDEFLVVLAEMTGPGDAGLVADRVVAEFRRPVTLPDAELRVTCSIGISAYPGDGDTLDALMKSADIAMYRAKETRNAFAFYSASLHESLKRRRAMEEGLRDAIGRGELELLYQPLFDLRNGSVRGVEALLRWNHPRLGTLSAPEFLPLADKAGSLESIGDWVLRSACQRNARWQERGLSKVPVSVNLGARQLVRPDFIDLLRRILEETGLDPRYLALEIAESTLGEAQNGLARAFDLLRELGVAAILDNFGTGGCSLALFAELRFSSLKIDRSFLSGISANRAAARVLESIIAMAHDLGMEVSVGGVETEEQLGFLRASRVRRFPDTRCDRVQGFLLGRPLSADAVTAVLGTGDAAR